MAYSWVDGLNLQSNLPLFWKLKTKSMERKHMMGTTAPKNLEGSFRVKVLGSRVQQGLLPYWS